MADVISSSLDRFRLWGWRIKLKNQTYTKTFGTGKRENHDSSKFYSRKICQTHKNTNQISDSNCIASKDLNIIFNKSSESMKELPDNSVALMITSPPYNVGKDYDTDMPLKDYLEFLRKVLLETHRVLVPGGRIAFNIANLGRKPYIPLNAHISHVAQEIGFLMRGEIIWVKGKGASGSCAWGSWMSAGNPTLRDLHEYILIFSKQRFDKPVKGKSTISRDEFLEATVSVWNIPAESAKRVGHPAPFPVSLADRLINLYSYEEEVVLDPFMGSGTTAVAAVKSNRNFVGYEINADYIRVANERISRSNVRMSA
jgi:modification methylase